MGRLSEKLTREEAIKLHRELWGWLAENPMKKKEDWPDWEKYDKVMHDCFCCDFTRHICENCPLSWPKTNDLPHRTPCGNSYFTDWKEAKAPEERSKYAALIRDLPEKKVEAPKPEFKIGDWVKILDKGCSFTSYMEFFAENNLGQFVDKYARKATTKGEFYQIVGIGKHSTQLISYGSLYVLQAQDGEIYLMHNNRQNSFELTSPPAPTPKYAIGDKVVPVSKGIWPSSAPAWDRAKAKSQPFLYVITTTPGEGEIGLSDTTGHSDHDYYLESDLIPYIEPVKKEPKPEVKVEEKPFKVGDRVKVTKNLRSYSKELTGKIGTIKYLNPSDALIKFDENIDGHDGMAHKLCEYGYGWYVMFENLELITEPPINLCPEKKTVTELSISYKFDGAVTTCVIQTEDGIFTGKAKCSPDDKWDEKTGRAFALLRANQKHTKAKIKQLKNK